MAWRIDEELVRGEIDNRTRGRVTGRLWFAGRDEPVALELKGDAWRDVAGHVLRFTNPTPKAGGAGEPAGLAAVQRGVVGDITASRKVKVPDCPMDEVMALIKARKPFPWHWGNSLYLEWYGENNGRVVIEAAHYVLELDPTRAWEMTEDEEAGQREANGRAMTTFMAQLTVDIEADGDEEAEPTSAAEARADAEQARMDLLLDRVQARVERARETGEKPDMERIMNEERERLRRERGEPEPEPLTPEEEAERGEWIAEMNAITDAAQAEAADEWEDDADPFADDADEDADEVDADADEDERWHPLVERCGRLQEAMCETIEARGWVADNAPMEHPLCELTNGVTIAAGRLAGALGTEEDADEWPPEARFAGAVLVRLKKAREHLGDALAGLTAADEQGLADAPWRAETRRELTAILAEVRRLILEVRAVLEDEDDEGV